MSESNSIFIKGARVNNLKNIDVEIPRDKLVVITGLSGEWKIIVGVRYPLCGGTASVCREFIRLRPPVLGEDE